MSLLANSFWLMVGRLATAVLNFALTVLLARRLGEAGLGAYAFITSVAYVGNVASTFGMDTFVMRSVARGDEEVGENVRAGLSLQLLISFAYILVVLGLAWVWDNGALAIYILILLPLAFSTVFGAVLRGVERMDLYFWVTAVAAAGGLLGSWLVLETDGSLVEISVAIVIANVVAAVVGVLLVGKAGKQEVIARPAVGTRCIVYVHAVSVHAVSLRRAVRGGGALALLMVAGIVLSQLGVWFLNGMAGEGAVGVFSAANRLVEAGRIVPAAVFGALFPRMARNEYESPLYAQLFWGAFVLFVGVAGIMQILAEPLMALVFDGYQQSVLPLKILIWGLPISLLRLRYSFELISAEFDRYALYATLLALALSLPCFWLLTTRLGIVGTSVATVCAIGFQSVSLYFAKWLTDSGKVL